MQRYKFIAVWHVDTRTSYCNVEHTRRELVGDVIRLYDGDMFVGQFLDSSISRMSRRRGIDL